MCNLLRPRLSKPLCYTLSITLYLASLPAPSCLAPDQFTCFTLLLAMDPVLAYPYQRPTPSQVMVGGVTYYTCPMTKTVIWEIEKRCQVALNLGAEFLLSSAA